MPSPNLIERALQIAASGDVRIVSEIIKRLKREGYSNVDATLQGGSLRRQLRQHIQASHNGSAAA